MNIFLNNELITLPSDYFTIEDLLKWKNIPQQGTAVALNDKIIKKMAWGVTSLAQNDRVSIISAAFGG